MVGSTPKNTSSFKMSRLQNPLEMSAKKSLEKQSFQTHIIFTYTSYGLSYVKNGLWRWRNFKNGKCLKIGIPAQIIDFPWFFGGPWILRHNHMYLTPSYFNKWKSQPFPNFKRFFGICVIKQIQASWNASYFIDYITATQAAMRTKQRSLKIVMKCHGFTLQFYTPGSYDNH